MTTEVDEAQPPQQQQVDVPSLIRGRAVVLVGRPASMTRGEFAELVSANGGRAENFVGRGVAVIVIGQRDWPVTDAGTLREPLRVARNFIRNENRRFHIISEQQFLTALGLESYRESVQRLYTLSTLTEVLGVSRQRIKAWVAAGLIRPAKVEYGVWYFDFREVSAAKKLSELFRSGVSLRRLRLSLEQLRRWIPEAQQPLDQVAVLEARGPMLIRLEDGDLAAADGQLHFDFREGEAEATAPPTLRLVTGPQTAAEWFEAGVEQEQAGYLEEAVESYREALLVGGPDAPTCFNLANALKALGRHEPALERYRQAVETDGHFADAWNNLGILLSETGRHEEACAAFRKALGLSPDDLRAHYNLADALDELGRPDEAAAHWRAYLRQDPMSQWAAYARQRLAAI